MVVIGIVVAGTTIGTSYTGLYSKITVPSETPAKVGIEGHPKTEVYPITKVESIQYLFAPQSSSNMHLSFSPS